MQQQPQFIISAEQNPFCLVGGTLYFQLAGMVVMVLVLNCFGCSWSKDSTFLYQLHEAKQFNAKHTSVSVVSIIIRDIRYISLACVDTSKKAIESTRQKLLLSIAFTNSSNVALRTE